MKLFGNKESRYITQMDAKPKIGMKITSFMEHLKTYISYYVAITSVIGIMWGGFVIYDNWRDGNKEMQNSVKSIINTQSRQEKTDSILLKNQIEIREDINSLKDNGIIYIERIDALQRSYIRYISNDKALTKTDFLEYMDGLNMESKKN